MHRLATVAAFGLLAAVPTVASAHPALAAGHGATTTATTTTTATATATGTGTVPAARTWGGTDRSAVARAAAGTLTGRYAPAPRLAAPRRAARSRATTATVTVTISSHCAAFCFVPEQVTVAVGDTVSWVNTSGAEHTVTRCTPAGCNGTSGGTGTDASFGSADVAAASGTTFTHVFSAPGTYVYYCTIHGYTLMHGTITVTAAPTTTTAPASSAPITTSTASSTAATAHRLASTGSDTGGVTAFAVLLLACGLAASGLGLRRRDVSPDP
ncbi:MAG TPA: plastocyanin/azurin family copper-binding protein [Acidimicrobiia bacterium]|nr:plastocyanin/azurin family copper-binding protein [Acidimicrobiia bacterium]